MKINKILSAVFIILSFFAGAAGMYVLVNYGPQSVQTVINKSEKEVTVIETGIADAVEKVYDATVVVGAYKNGQLSSTGTGFVYDQDDKFAYILTNSHVVNGSTSVKVKFTNDNIEDVELIGDDTYTDIAVLKIKKEKIISVAEIGDNKTMRVGDTVFAIGAPLNDEYSWTVTRGILSGKDRIVTINTDNYSASDWVMNVLQTDASINSGNSGGPLANSNGEVIGITNMKLVSDGVEGMGFAIPITDAIDYAAEIRKSGEITRPYLGISMIDTSETYKLSMYNIKVDSSLSGAVIAQTEEKSPADKAGLEKGDVIIKIGEHQVTSVAKLKYYLYKFSPGEKVTITFVRDGKTKTTEIELGKSE